MAISDWSTTASSNGNSDANINWQEGQAPSTVNDSARSMMSRLKHWWNQLGANTTQGGSSNAYTITSGESLTAYANGMRFLFQPNADSTGNTTLNVDTIGAKKIYLPDGSQAGNGDLDADSMYDVVYDTALDSAAGGFKIVGFPDASAVSGNLADIQALADPGTDKMLGWDDSASAVIYFGLGTGVRTNGTDLEASTNLQLFHNTPLTAAELGELQNIDSVTISNTQWGYLGATGGTIWTTANDGAGSGLDADTLDGVQGSGFAQLSGADFTGKVTVTNSNAEPFVVQTTNTAGEDVIARFEAGGGRAVEILQPATYNSSTDAFIFATSNSLKFRVDATDAIEIDQSGNVSIGSNLTAPVAISSETNGTLTTASANKQVQISGGGITLPASVFSAGDMILLNTGGPTRTITRGSGAAMYVGGSDSASATLSAYGVALVYYRDATTAILLGNVS